MDVEILEFCLSTQSSMEVPVMLLWSFMENH